nr:hypothetical protein [Candidatus Sigynarchaeota archaeon]
MVDKREEIQVHGVYYLGEIGKASPELANHIIYPLIMLLLKPRNFPSLAFHVLNALEKINKDSQETKDYLLKGITDVAYMQVPTLYVPDPSQRKTAVWLIVKLGGIYFPAIIDLVPILFNMLVDVDDGVRIFVVKKLSDLFSLLPEEITRITLDNLSNIENANLKLEIYTLLDEFTRKDPKIINSIIPLAIKELQTPNRAIYLKVHRLLKTCERLSPTSMMDHRLLLLSMLLSTSRYAYHWAIQTFSTTFMNYLRLLAKQDVSFFVDEVLGLTDLLVKNNKGLIMQTRVVLMMLVHETSEALLQDGLLMESARTGLLEGLSQIQKSGLTSETEVIAAFEKFKTFLNNSKLFMVK